MRLFIAGIALALTGCGRVSFDSVSDAQTDTVTGSPDAACVFGPWGAPSMLSELNTPFLEYGAWMSSDRLEIFFTSDRGGGAGGLDIWRAERLSQASPFGPAEVVNVSSPMTEDNAFLLADGLTLFFDRSGLVHTASRPMLGAPFGTAVQVTELANGGTANGSSSLTTDGLTIMFQSNRDADDDIYVATRPSLAAPFGLPVRDAVLSGAGRNDQGPSISGDGREVVFMHDANDVGHDLWLATGGPNWSIVPFPPASVTSAFAEADPFVTFDGRTAVWSARPTGNFELYVATRECL